MIQKKADKPSGWFKSSPPLFLNTLVSSAKAHLTFLVAGVMFCLFLGIAFFVYPDKSLLINENFPGLTLGLLGISTQSQGNTFGPSLWYRGAMVVLSSGIFILFSAWRWTPSIYETLRDAKTERAKAFDKHANAVVSKKLTETYLQRKPNAELATVFAFAGALSAFGLAFFAIDKALFANRLLQAVLGLSIPLATLIYVFVYISMAKSIPNYRSFFLKIAAILLIASLVSIGAAICYLGALVTAFDAIALTVIQAMAILLTATMLGLTSFWSIRHLKRASEDSQL